MSKKAIPPPPMPSKKVKPLDWYVSEYRTSNGKFRILYTGDKSWTVQAWKAGNWVTAQTGLSREKAQKLCQ